MTALTLLQRSFTAHLAPLSRAYRKHIDRAFSGLAVSHTLALPVMLLGRLGDGVRQGELSDELGMEGPSLVPVLDQLERSGLVERRPDPTDKRAKTLHLTATGHDLAARVEVIAADVRTHLLQAVSPEDLAATIRVLDQFRDALNKAEE